MENLCQDRCQEERYWFQDALKLGEKIISAHASNDLIELQISNGHERRWLVIVNPTLEGDVNGTGNKR